MVARSNANQSTAKTQVVIGISGSLGKARDSKYPPTAKTNAAVA